MTEVTIKQFASQLWSMVTLPNGEQIIEDEIEAFLIGLVTTVRRTALRQYEASQIRRVETVSLFPDFTSEFVDGEELWLLLTGASGLDRNLGALFLDAARRRIDSAPQGLRLEGLGAFNRSQDANFYYDVSLDPSLCLIAGHALGTPQVMRAGAH